MATGPSASGGSVRRTANLPSPTNFTITGSCYFNGTGSTGTYTLCALESAVTSASSAIQLFFNSPHQLQVLTSASYPTSFAFAEPPRQFHWFNFAMQGRGTGGTDILCWWAYPGDRNLRLVTMTGISFTSGSLSLGNASYGDWDDLRFSNIKVWDAVLSPSEILTETNTPYPKRLTNLNSWNPLLNQANVQDYSGNGRSFAVVGTVTDYQDPGIGLPVPKPSWMNSNASAAVLLQMAGIPADDGVGAETTTGSLQQAGGLSQEAAGAETLAESLQLAGAPSEETPGFPGIGVGAGSGAGTGEAAGAPGIAGAVTQAGVPADDGVGAETLAGSTQQAGSPSGEASGAQTLAGSVQQAGGQSQEAAGADTLAGSSTQAGAPSEETAGAETLAGSLQQAGSPSGEASGAETLAGAGTQAGSPSGEVSGAETLAGSLQQAGGQSAEAAGADTLSSSNQQAGAPSEEVAGAASAVGVLQAGAGAPSGEAEGAPTLAASAQQAGSPSAEAAGAETLAVSTSAGAGAPSEEVAGAVQVGANLNFVGAGAGGPSGESPGASTLAVTAAPATAGDGSGAGADTLAASLSSGAGSPSAEASGAETLAGGLAQAGAPSGEVAGAETLAITAGAGAGAYPGDAGAHTLHGDPPAGAGAPDAGVAGAHTLAGSATSLTSAGDTSSSGASSLAAAVTQAGAPSQEAAGAVTVFTPSIIIGVPSAGDSADYGSTGSSGLLRLASAPSDEAPGAVATLILLRAGAGAPSEEFPGAAPISFLTTSTLVDLVTPLEVLNNPLPGAPEPRVPSGTLGPGIHQSDVVIREALEVAIADIRRHPYLLDYVFASLVQDGLTAQKYGVKERDRAKEWFLASDIPVGMDYHLDPLALPNYITVSLVDSTEAENTLGDVHYDTQEDTEADWPPLTPSFSPVAYSLSSGVLTLPDPIANSLVVTPGMLVVDRNGRSYSINDTISDTQVLLNPGLQADFDGVVIKGAQPKLITTLESVAYRESYRVGANVHGEPSHLMWLYSVVTFILLRYKQSLLEARGFERSVLAWAPHAKNEMYGRENMWTRFVNVTGYVRHYWPKQTGIRTMAVVGQPLQFSAVGSQATQFAPDGGDADTALWFAETDGIGVKVR